MRGTRYEQAHRLDRPLSGAGMCRGTNRKLRIRCSAGSTGPWSPEIPFFVRHDAWRRRRDAHQRGRAIEHVPDRRRADMLEALEELLAIAPHQRPPGEGLMRASISARWRLSSEASPAAIEAKGRHADPRHARTHSNRARMRDAVRDPFGMSNVESCSQYHQFAGRTGR